MSSSAAAGTQKKPSFHVSPWCNSPWKRFVDIAGAVVLLLVLFPFMGAIALMVKLTSRGPALFRQRRPGRNGDFVIFKFRTMRVSNDSAGPALTWTADPRVTGLGRFLRKWKLDELPQLLNVLRGDMSFVGPRPLPPALWNGHATQEEAACVLSVRPGITGHAALNFRNEEELFVPLSTLPASRAEEEYVRHVMPRKLELELEYLRTASFVDDCRVIFATVFRVLNLNRAQHQNSNIRQSLQSAIQEKDPATHQVETGD